MIWVLLIGVVACLVWYTCTKPMSYWKNLEVKQSKPWPFFGDAWTTLFRRMTFCEFIEWVYNMYPHSRYSGCYLFCSPSLVLRDPDLIKQITIKDFDHFTDHRPFADPDADPLWGGNLFALRGQRWREMRATLSGSFTSSKMKNLFHLIEEVAENFVRFFLDKNEDIVDVEMKDVFTRYTNDVIATTAFGIKCDSLTEPDNEFYRMGKAATDVRGISMVIKFFGNLFFPKIFKLLKIPFIPKAVATFFRNAINETIQVREEQGIVRPDMIDILLKARKGVEHEEHEAVEAGFATVKESADIGKFKQTRNITNEDIMAQALIFFFAGFDTVSTALCFGSYELAINKEVQDKLRKEIKETNAKANGKITYDILLKIKYLDMVVSEILRIWPPLVGMDRIVTKPYTIQPTTPDEKPVPLRVDDAVMLPVYGIHRDPTYWPNPGKFDPERFSDENKENIKPYTYIPFGSGPRNCIGSRFALLEIKALLYNLLLNFEIIPTEKTTIPLKLDRNSIQHTAEGGFWFALKRT